MCSVFISTIGFNGYETASVTGLPVKQEQLDVV